MSHSDLISLLSYYLGIIAVLVAFFSVQIEAWSTKVGSLVTAWSPAKRKAETQFKLHQDEEKKNLHSGPPWLAVWVPAGVGGSLLGLGGYALMFRAAADVSREDIALFLLIPAGLLLIVYLVCAIVAIRRGRSRLELLQD